MVNFCVHKNLLFYYCLLSPCIVTCKIYLISSIAILWVDCRITHPHHLCIFICRYQKLYYYCTLTSMSTLIFLTNWPPTCLIFFNDAPGGMSLFIYMHSFSCIILLHLPVVFCVGKLLCLFVSSGFSCTCRSPAKYSFFEPFFIFADILVIRVVFTQTSHWFSQYPYPSPISMWIYHHYENYWWNMSPANFTSVTCPLYFTGVTCPLYIHSIIARIIFHISSRMSPNR